MKRTVKLDVSVTFDDDGRVDERYIEDSVRHAIQHAVEAGAVTPDDDSHATMNKFVVNPVASDIEIPRMLVLSTSHITHRTSLILDGKRPGPKPLLFPKGEHGWIIPIIDPLGADADEDARWSLPEIRAIRELAEANGCTWIMLDQAADTIEALPVYDW